MALEMVQKGKYRTQIQYFEFKICLQCSDLVLGKNFGELLSRVYAVITTLYGCMGKFSLPSTVRSDMQIRRSMPRSFRIHSSDGIILQDSHIRDQSSPKFK